MKIWLMTIRSPNRVDYNIFKILPHAELSLHASFKVVRILLNEPNQKLFICDDKTVTLEQFDVREKTTIV